MKKRQLPVDRTDDQLEIQARRAGRLGDLAEEIRPVLTSEPLECRGVAAEVYKTAAEKDLGPLSLDDIAVILVHKGTIEASLLFAAVQHVLSTGGLAVLPAATAMMLHLCNADFTIIYLKPEHIPGIHADLLRGREVVPQLDPHDVQLAMLVGCVRDEMQSGFPGGRHYFESLAVTLATRIYDRHGMKAVSGGTFRGGLTARQVRQAKNTILTDLDKAIRLATLAEEARLSPSHFCRAFKQSTGVSPHSWRLEKRFERARRLMTDDRMTITNIALHLGFASLSHFSVAFKRATGFSPSHYRRKVAP